MPLDVPKSNVVDSVLSTFRVTVNTTVVVPASPSVTLGSSIVTAAVGSFSRMVPFPSLFVMVASGALLMTR